MTDSRVPLLLNPGPVTLSDTVRKALLRPDLCHREPEFSELQSAIRHKLLQVHKLDQKDWAAVLLTGSGTAAVEAMLSSLVPVTGRVLIVANGVYGERMARMAAIHGIDHEICQHDWHAGIDLAAIEQALQQKTCSHIAVVQHETTTGRLNDIAALAALASRYQVELLLDAVSSFAAEEIDFIDWPIAGCAATANKCLHGVPGISFVICQRQALADAAQRTLYMHLPTYAAAQDNGGTPFTQSVQCCYALDAALDEFLAAGGRPARQRLYQQRMQQVRSGLVGLGIEPLLEDAVNSCVLNAFRLPAGLSYTTLHDELKQAGFVIYAGQGEFAKTLFRIAVMGELQNTDLERLLDAIKRLLMRD
ncbi:MAG: 2-aminoethylphosphonate aminotransferase [Gammaproteobacteria bacterium]